MSHSWLGSLLALALAAGCLLPDVSVDPDLEVVDPLEPMGGSGGTTSQVVTGAAGSGVMASAGSGGTGAMMTPPPSGGAGGSEAAIQPVLAPAAGAGGTGGTTSKPPPGLGGKTVDEICPTTTDSEQACAEYCDVYATACSDFTGVYEYANANDCAVTCYKEGWPIGTTSEKGSIMCRCYHSTLALTEGQTPHCYHAAKNPTMGGCQVTP